MAKPTPTLEELRARLATYIEVHEYAQSPHTDENDIKGYLTYRKNEVRRQIKKALQENK